MNMNHSLHEIAVACHNGASNPVGLLNSFADAIKDVLKQPEGYETIKNGIDTKYIIGHVSFLLGESLGPSEKTVENFKP